MTFRLFRFAALALCAGLIFTICTGCAPAASASSGAPASSVAAESTAPEPTTIPLPDPLPTPLEPTEEELAAPCAAYEEIKALLNADPNAIVYERTGDTVTATLTLPLESGTVAMEYTFGLVPDAPAPFSRTYLQSARRA